MAYFPRAKDILLGLRRRMYTFALRGRFNNTILETTARIRICQDRCLEMEAFSQVPLLPNSVPMQQMEGDELHRAPLENEQVFWNVVLGLDDPVTMSLLSHAQRPWACPGKCPLLSRSFTQERDGNRRLGSGECGCVIKPTEKVFGCSRTWP